MFDSDVNNPMFIIQYDSHDNPIALLATLNSSENIYEPICSRTFIAPAYNLVCKFPLDLVWALLE